jgi:hypothetical protein
MLAALQEKSNEEIERDCLKENYCNIQKVDSSKFSAAYQLMVESYKDGLGKKDSHDPFLLRQTSSVK